MAIDRRAKHALARRDRTDLIAFIQHNPQRYFLAQINRRDQVCRIARARMCQLHTLGNGKRPRNLDFIARPLCNQRDITCDRRIEIIFRAVQIPAAEGITVARRLRTRLDRRPIGRDDLRRGNRASVRHADIKGHRVRLRLFDLLPHGRQSCVLPRSKFCPLLYIILRVILTVDCPTEELVTIKCGRIRFDLKILFVIELAIREFLIINICGIVSTSRDPLCTAQAAFIANLIAKRQIAYCQIIYFFSRIICTFCLVQCVVITHALCMITTSCFKANFPVLVDGPLHREVSRGNHNATLIGRLLFTVHRYDRAFLRTWSQIGKIDLRFCGLFIANSPNIYF